jgi:hypothetical protein
MWNGNLHHFPMSNSNNDPPVPSDGVARSIGAVIDTDQLDAVSALTSLQGTFPPYFTSMDHPMVVAANGYFPPPPMYATSTSQGNGLAAFCRPPRDEPPRSILEMNHIYAPPRGPPVASGEEEEEEIEAEPVLPVLSAPVLAPVPPRGKPESVAARARLQQEEVREESSSALPKKPPASSARSKSSPKKKKKSSSQPAVATVEHVAPPVPREFLLGEPVPLLTEAEYRNLTELLLQFCKVPLLAEFRRPVAILHPEVRDCYWQCVEDTVLNDTADTFVFLLLFVPTTGYAALFQDCHLSRRLGARVSGRAAPPVPTRPRRAPRRLARLCQLRQVQFTFQQ